MGFKDMIISMLLVGLFTLAIITFGINLATENSANESILNDPRINTSFADLNSSLSKTQSEAESFKNASEQEKPTQEQNFLILSIPATARGISDRMTSIFNVIMQLARDSIFGATFLIVFTVIFSIFFINGLLFIWELLRTGRSR